MQARGVRAPGPKAPATYEPLQAQLQVEIRGGPPAPVLHGTTPVSWFVPTGTSDTSYSLSLRSSFAFTPPGRVTGASSSV
jgi:hypothetical protein